MSRFVYRMQSILNIKEELEKQARADFGMAMVQVQNEEEKLEGIWRRRDAYEEAARGSLQGSFGAREMRENKEAILRMEEFAELQREEVRKAWQRVAQERQKLQRSMQERKIQEKLRENAFSVFLEEEKARESREIDELTSYTYGQKRAEEAVQADGAGDGADKGAAAP